MARKTEIFVVTSEGRDKGKRFMLTEMPALKAERWALRALLALARSGAEIPDDARSAGMQGLALAGIKALHSLDFGEAEPLLNEMWDCLQVMPDPANPGLVRKPILADIEGCDIEEIQTVWELREAIFRLHTDFFFSVSQSKAASRSSSTKTSRA